MKELGLKGAFKSLRQRSIKSFFWELRYAWQRAWRGYDDVDVFELCFNMSNKLLVLVKEFKEYNDALFTDWDTCKTLSIEETNAILDQMIYYLEGCDEDRVYKRMYGVEFFDDDYDTNRWKAVVAETEKQREEAARLISKWFWSLWY